MKSQDSIFVKQQGSNNGRSDVIILAKLFHFRVIYSQRTPIHSLHFSRFSVDDFKE